MPPLTPQNKGPLLLVVVLLGLLILMSAQVKSAGATLLEQTLFRLTSPILRLTYGTLSFLEGGWSHYVDLRGVRQANEKLASRALELEVEHQQLDELRRENVRLRALLGLRAQGTLSFIAAKVIVNQAFGSERAIIVDQGMRNGVFENMPAAVGEGVVGRVVRVDPGEAVIQLITDAGSAVAVRFERTGLQGMLTGRGSDTLRLHYIPQHEDVVVGDCLLTSGHDRIYPQDLRVGCVSRVGSITEASPRAGLMMEIDVEPVVRFSRLREVLMLSALPASRDPSQEPDQQDNPEVP